MIKHTLSNKQDVILNVILNEPGRDWTNREIAKKLNWDISSVTPRTRELKDKGLLYVSTTRFCRVKKSGIRVQAMRAKEGFYL